MRVDISSYSNNVQEIQLVFTVINNIRRRGCSTFEHVVRHFQMAGQVSKAREGLQADRALETVNLGFGGRKFTWKGFSPVCSLSWMIRFALVVRTLSQYLHG